MKTKFLLNRSGMSPEVTCRKGRHAIESIVSRFSLASLICLCMLTIGSGNVWGAIDANSTWTATAFGSLSDDATVIILNNFGNAIPNADATSSGPLKVAASYNSTTHKISVTTAGKSLDNIVWTVKKTNNGTKFYVYGSSTKTLGLSGTSSNTAVRVNTSLSYTEFVMGSSGYLLKYYNASRYVGEYTGGSDWRSYNSETAANYKSSGTQQTLTFYVLDAATPTVTPTPTSLDWGTVLQGSSQSTKTITITGANLTAGTLTISATGGYSVTPTSKSVSGTLAATTLTVTPPSTSTTGAKNGKVTISGGGLASNVEVNLSMTVNAASTVTWMNNGSEYTTTLVANGSKPEFPDNPSSCDGTSTTFVGWTPTPWSGKLDDVSSKTIYTSGSAMPNVGGPVTYHAVFAKSTGSETEHTLTLNKDKFYAAGATSSGYASTDLTIDGIVMKRSQWGWQQNGVNVYLQGKTSNAMYNDTQLGYIKSIAITKYGGSGNIYVGTSKQPTTNETAISTTTLNYTKSNNYTYFRINSTSTLQLTSVVITYVSGSVTYSKYLTTCCADPGLNYGTASVTKTYGASAFTNTLTNSHNVAVTYSSSDPTVATVNGSGQVTILKAGSTTITASSAAQTVSTVDYCADEASYTLTVNKADISPTLTYTPNSVAVGENSSAPSVSGNTGSGTVSYAITSATPAGCATINASTGVVTGVAVGSVTVTATVAATTNYNGNTATATVSVTAASNFPNGKTIFIQANSSSAWNDNACVVAWFHSYGGSETAQSTYWLFDATDDDAGKKLFAAVVPASGNLPYLDINRFASDCTTPWNKNGGCSYSDASGSNTVRSEGSGNDQVYWNPSPTALYLYGSQNSWGSSLGTFADQGSGVWTATISNYTPDATSKDYKIKTSYNQGWIGNKVDGDHQNENATLSGMIVGSTYNVTATLDVTDHSLVMSKTFVKGTVHFNMQSHGSAISDLTNVTAGSKISAPSEPSDAAYNFGGWYKDAECTDDWDFANDVVNETMTLYAKWTLKTYTINYNKGTYGTGSNTNDTKTHDVNLTLRGALFTRDHYTQTAWNTADNGSGTTYTLSGTYTANAGTTLYPVWTPVNYTVTWYAGGTESGNITTEGSPSTSVAYNSKVTTLPTNPDGSPCDKTFVGWTNTTSYTHGTSLLFTDAAGSPTITGATNFYAVFAEDGGSSYVLVESDLGTDWAGDYLIAYSSTVFADGRVGGTGTGGLGKQYQKANPGDKLDGKVVDVDWGDTYHIILEEVSSNSNTYLLKTQDGLYNYVSSNSNGLSTTSTRATAALYPITVTFTSSSDVRLGLGGSAAGAVFRYNASEYFRYYANCTQNAVYLYKKTGGYTGHTINCADCGTSVTPTYTASPTGGTVSVTKSASPVTSGSTVKTCTAVDLTVTLTPATHYDLTGFTATGLTTGTATITPAVGSTLPVSVAQTFTVTVSAGATGTLTLAPTFTAQTPLTITLSTNSKGTFTAPTEFPIYAGETFTFPDVTPNDPTCATFVGWIAGTTFVGDGTTHDAPATIAASTVSDPQNSNATYTAVFYETETSESDAYVKVTSTPANWANDHYLIVYEDGGVAFDGSRTDGDGDKIDAASNTVAVSITSSAIAATNALAASEWKIALISGSNYSIQSASGKYIGNASNSNALSTSSSALANTLSISSGDFEVVSDGGAYLRYNATSGQERFRYYKSSSYSSQQAIQLYKLGTAVVETRTYTTNPSCTPKYRVTVASVTGGSPSADPKYNPESTEVTITANPAAGYTFTSWTITKTTGGDNVTSTLLTGDKPTTANTTFAMPAYDVTVTAMYAKIYVTSVVAKDGETTLNTSDHKLNINTGANKTVTVVVTPADAFDHSWSAEVTSGGTYASISNVTSEGFRVNGLAAGDATIVVTAPNDDGTDRTATFTVHVTDVLPEEIILKREGSDTPIETLIMYYDASESKGQYVKVNVGYSPSNPTNKAFTFESALSGKVGSHSHAPASGYEVLVANGVTTDPVNCTFTSAADGSVTKVLAVTVLPILTDQFVDYIHGNATQTVSARLSADRYDIITDINTPSLSDASDSDPTSEDCETAHYHLIGWLPQATAEALWAAGTPITEATEGLVKAGVQVEATGQTWYAIWGKEE